MVFTHHEQLSPETDRTQAEKLNPEDNEDKAIMIVARMREAWALDLRTPEGMKRLQEIREEVNYLTTDRHESTDEFAERTAREIVQAAEAGAMTKNSVLEYDPTNVVHRATHPHRPYDDSEEVTPELREDIRKLLKIGPDTVKQLASRDMLIPD